MKVRNLLSFLLGMSLAASAGAVPTVNVGLVPIDPINNPGAFTVMLDYTADPAGAGLTFIQLDASPSSANLTVGGTDFSRFSFTPSAVLANWNIDALSPIPGPISDFGLGSSLYTVDLESSTSPMAALLAGIHNIGTLVVNLNGLPAGVAIVQFGGVTDFGQENPVGDFGSFQLFSDQNLDGTITSDPVTFQIPQSQAAEVPEPATAMLGLMTLGVLAMRRRKSA